MTFIYRIHAIERMFERNISQKDVEVVFTNGETIEVYDEDKPYPSFLVLAYIEQRPLHVVFAKDDEENVFVITAYEPTLLKWQNNMKTRKD